MSEEPMLSTHALTAGYGDFQALFGVDFEVRAGEVVALIGANGAGKSTLLRSILGLLSVARDMVRFRGESVGGSKPHAMVRNGIGIVPEGRRLFAGMSIEDNLRVAIDYGRKPQRGENVASLWTIERIYKLFPILRERRDQVVHNLSGGQQQMVAIGRALLTQPMVLLCDEISLGLAPKVIHEIYDVLPMIRQAGTALVLVEQDVSLAQRASDRLYCMLEGRITLTGDSNTMTREAIAEAYFGANHAVA
ncbi:ABC transporter ATP-binding protein [Bradyrhizobium cajani]|uniref:ATP-binding cassette domain-containing protein n=1 Tax=Bradyrhizobium cajani TaxID=1928661 RepID=A0A844TBJ7_9BRAD|nr:ABC transporter ATP-binding protein [Bradyrhizobium cajani]MCP3369582.1 ABC transporter ATP-binding protein [Bradyrhizobium cajani]MVT71990.1 ATP-binding cassette domain-containing protein [Bradyrhizobium cajani]